MADAPRTLVIRADAGTQMGTGHVMRCLALAQAWQDGGGRAVFATAAPPPLEDRLRREGMEVVAWSAVAGSRQDARETAELARQRDAAWVVVDGYQFDGEYQRTIKQADLRLLAVDDNGHADHYAADLVLNQNLHADEALYADREPNTRLLLGTQYVLLRREFWHWRGRRADVPPVARKLLVAMGGTDPPNVTGRVLQAIERLELGEFETVVLMGTGNPHRPQLEEAARAATTSVQLQMNVGNMPELMAWAEAAITAAGSTTWELAMIGVPSMTVILAENQQSSAELLAQRGVFPTLGWCSAIEEDDLVCRIREFLLDERGRRIASEQASRLVDGNGVRRVMESMANAG